MKLTSVIFAGAALFLMSTSISYSQTCEGSVLTYIVRGADGKAIDAGDRSISFVAKSTEFSQWKVSKKEFVPYRIKKVPKNIVKLKGNISALETWGYCDFRYPVELVITLNNKEMHLKFLTPRMANNDDKFYLVDSRPFSEGIFEIDLTKDPKGPSRYYAASQWKTVK